MDFEMEWRRDPAPGGAALVIKLSGEELALETTYVGDGLGSVLRAALDLGKGSSSALAFLPSEPSGVCLFFSGAEVDVYLQVVRFADMQSPENRWAGGRLLGAGRIRVRDFITQVVLMVEGILDAYGGADGYKRDWGGVAFPEAELDALRRLASDF
jgi:hypothetical protein